MSLRYIMGRSGSGKTELCMRELTEALSGKPLIYIVPEQFSLESEKKLIRMNKGKALIDIQVLSFQRLAFRVFSEMGGYGYKVLDGHGKTLLLRKIVNDLDKSLLYFTKSADKQGFMEQLSHTISEFYEYGVTVEQLEARLQAYTEGYSSKTSLPLKLGDLTKIYRAYQEYIADNYITVEETLDLLAGKIEASSFLEGASIWLDGFIGFTPQEYKVLEQLMRRTSQISITFTLPQPASSYYGLEEADPFIEGKKAVNRITKLARAVGLEIEEPVWLEENRRFQKAPMLAYLESQYFQPVGIGCQGQGRELFFSSAANYYEEVKNAAETIIELVRDRDFNYSEIGVATGALKDYSKVLDTVFHQYGIPFFLDLTTDILSHPLTEFIRSALDAARYNWSYESVFRFLKTGLLPIQQDEVDILENYVLAYGIKGGSWNKEFMWGFDNAPPGEKERVNGLREKVLSFLWPFTSAVGKGRKRAIRGFAEELFKMLEKNNIVGALSREENRDRLRQSEQVWRKICEIFNKMAEILGDETVTLKEFAKITEAGLSSADLGRIPPTQDQVQAGDLVRSRFPRIRALILIGVNEGVLPAVQEEAGLFSDNERDDLTARGVELRPGSRGRAFQEDFLIYSGITRPEEFLYVSYSRGTLEGKALQPSTLITKLKKLFPEQPFIEKQDELRLTLPWAAFRKMGCLMRGQLEQVKDEKLLEPLYTWFKNSSDYKDRLIKLEELLIGKDPEERLAPNYVSKLYGGEIITGASRLEQYVKCPYAYFLRYNLDARERRIYQVEAVDLGNLFHDVLEDISLNIRTKNLSWRGLDKEMIASLVEDAVSRLAPELNGQVFLSSERYKYLIKRVARIAKRSVWALSEHIKRGAFEPLAEELIFSGDSPLTGITVGINDKQAFVLTGRIDRIDIMDCRGNRYIKIIDYKSGSTKFDIKDIYFGMQLQLILYLDAFIKNGGKFFGSENITGEILPGGVFYFNINDPIIDYPGELDQSGLDEMLLKSFKMTGLVLDEEEVIRGLDENIKGYSDVIPVYLKADGRLGSNSSAAGLEEYNKLRQAVLDKISQIGQDITQGDISVFPYKKGMQTACDYCGYSGICQFDAMEGKDRYNVVT